MIAHLEMWQSYIGQFIKAPTNIYVFIFSLILSSAFYLLFMRTESIKRKMNFLALHIVFLFFPFIFTAVFWKCTMPLASCSPMIFMISAPIAGIIAIVSGFILLPYIYRWSDKNQIVQNGFASDFVAEQSRKLGIKEPEIYSINDIKPIAYSITNLKPAIFISAGLSELLTKKEMEAVLLHELHHHKSKAYFWKFSGNML